MAFDVSRNTFDAWKDYLGVAMEQGRVQTDADWNEWLAEFTRRIDAGTLDALGRAVVPATTPDAFRVIIPSAGGTLSIGCGRMYVDGLLVENHGPYADGAFDKSGAVWDPALEETSGAAQPPPPPGKGQFVDFAKQRYSPGASLSALAAGQYVAYLDVWRRPVVHLQDDDLVDKAIGIDTSGRVQTVWQVKLAPVPQGQTWNCGTPNLDIFPLPSAGLLSTGVVANPTSGPCCLTTGDGYTGVENQLYRVEIHDGGSPGDPAGPSGATFKWSRDNASVATLVTDIAPGNNSLGAPAFQLTVTSLGRDGVLGFTPGNWVELIDETLDLTRACGEMYLIDGVEFSSKTITLTTQLQASSHFTLAPPPAYARTRIRRWDQSGVVYEADGKTVWFDLSQAGSDGTVPVPLSDTTLILENGVVVTFGLSNPKSGFNVGDFWTFAARTADGGVESLVDAPPRGVHHHYTKLSVMTWPNGPTPDCRQPWPLAGEGAGCGCCGVSVGPNAQFSSIQLAIASLPATGGEVTIMPGRYFEYVCLDGLTDVVIKGCGPQTRIASPALQSSGAGSAKPVATATGLSGVVEILASRHVRLIDLCIEAADECGVLIDGAAKARDLDASRRNVDIRLADLAIAGSTLPGILVYEAELVEIVDNRIAMAKRFSKWPAVYLSGRELRFRHNWVGLVGAALDRLPSELRHDLSSAAVAVSDAAGGLGAPGGVQIAGGAKDVFVIENEIEGGDGNGVTLGSLILIDGEGKNTGGLTGVVFTGPDDCAKSTGNLVPKDMKGAAAGAPLVDVTIARNRIRDMGLSGIGPVALFDLAEILEVVSIENLAILGNTIERCLNWRLDENGVGYGAICVPDVKNLRIFDNVITDFGATPGEERAWGILILYGELVEISRNRVLETRDWSLVRGEAEPQQSATGRGGIGVGGVAPPTLAPKVGSSAWTPADSSNATATFAPAELAPIFEPGLPALRVDDNVVRVARGPALTALGLGAFSIVGNHLATGGLAPVSGSSTATTVELLNLGSPIDLAQAIARYLDVHGASGIAASNLGATAPAAPSNGTVLFANNVCQLEARANTQKADASVLVATLDHVSFANNVCWVDGPGEGPILKLDAIVLGMTAQVTSNRFQESPESVIASASTTGLMNVTSLNMSTYKVYPSALDPSKLGPVDNVSWA